MSSEVMPANQQSWTETPPQNPPIRHLIGQFVESQTWLDKLAAPLQSWLLKLFGQPGEPNSFNSQLCNGAASLSSHVWLSTNCPMRWRIGGFWGGVSVQLC